MIVKINEDIFVDSLEVCSVQREIVEKYCSGSPSDSSTYVDFSGSVVTLKNGRKIYVRGMEPKQIMNILDDV